MSQSQLRALAGKFGNAAILAKLYLTYEQFEHLLRIISVAKPQPSNRSEKVRFFFSVLGQSLRIQFGEQSSTINRSNSSYSLNSELNESNSSLDLSIKEALDTIKSEIQKPNVPVARVNLSPRPVGRAYSSPSTPKSRSLKGFTNEATSKIRVSLLSPTSSLKGYKPRNKYELDEFLETEKLVQKEVSSFKVSLRPETLKRTENRTLNRAVDVKNKAGGRFVGLQMVSKEKQLEKTVSNMSTLISKHKKYIEKIQGKRLSTKFLARILFKTWALESFRAKHYRQAKQESEKVEEMTEKISEEMEVIS